MQSKTLRIVAAGLSGGLLGNGVLGVLFTSPWLHQILYDPAMQSPLFLQITPLRNVPVSIAGLVLLSVIHAWLYSVLRLAIPGTTWIKQGLFWGTSIWLMFWLFQEWFIYHTLLGEPLLLNLLELSVLLLGSWVEGIVIAWFWRDSLTHREHYKIAS